MFTVNHDEAMELGELPEGEYEVVVAKAFENVAKSGTECMDIQLIVRNDIEQPRKGSWIFHKTYVSKDTGEYHSGIVNAIAKALKLPNGKQYSSVEEILNDMLYKTAKVTIRHGEFEGRTKVEVSNWKQTEFPQCNHQWKDGKIPVNGPVNGKEDDFGNIEGFRPTSNDEIPF